METNDLEMTGVHHVTAITAIASENLRFYTGALGMRLVKKTVNQDDVSAYHLFYADACGSPGSDLTFFDWPAARERRGTGSIVRTGLRIGSVKTARWWATRFAGSGIPHEKPAERDGRMTLDFEDPEGQRLSLVVDETGAETTAWERSSVPAEHQVRGLGPVVISVPELAPTDLVLTNALNMRRTRKYRWNGMKTEVHVYRMAGEGPAAEVHVAVEPDASPVRQGAGGVHHVAFRVPTLEEHDAWVERLDSLSIPNSGPVERYYFRSLYFREPGGILFEVATDGPGFTVDEPLETLGEKLALPPFLEDRRAAIEAGLKPL